MRSVNYATPETLDAKTHEWLQLVRSSVHERPGLKVVPERCALLVIDMLHYFAAPDGRAYLPASASIVPRVRSLVDAWRQAGGTLVFTRHCHDGTHDLGMLGKFFLDYIRNGELESTLIPALEPLATETVLRKTTYDAFFGTALQETLERRHITQVLVTGVLTHMCCETTARSAFVRGFEVFVPADATATSQERLHVGSLLGMADSVAVITSTQEVLERCLPTP